MIDFRVDLTAVRNAKEQKNAMLTRLKQIDIEGSGLITLDSLVTIADRYDIHLTQADMQIIKERYRKATNSQAQACKVEYVRVLNDIKMRLDHEGKVNWVFSSNGGSDTKNGFASQ